MSNSDGDDISIIHPISIGKKPVNYRKSTGLEDKTTLEGYIRSKGIDIKIGSHLKGGVDSQVYEAILNSQAVVVKHTEDRGYKLFDAPFSPVDFYIRRENQNIDSKMLRQLSKTNIAVPKLLYYFPEKTVAIMNDARSDGSKLMSSQLLLGELNMKSATSIGTQLGHLCIFGQKIKEFRTVKNRYMQIFERGLELRLAYPNLQEDYKYLENEYIKNVQGWMWPDGHPKNIFVNDSGDPIFIDFGGSFWGDQRFVLPNFLAHIVLYYLAGYLKKDETAQYLNDCIRSYDQIIKVNETIFCKYLGMEILHRSFGKWIEGINAPKQKVACISFGLNIFENNISTVNGLINTMAD